MIYKIFLGASLIAFAYPTLSEAAEDASDDSIIVTGTRRAERTIADSNVPVDVLSRADLSSAPSADLNDKLAQLIPSFNVQRMPGFDGAQFVRPATLRGLSPDQTLVLLNGKRRHRNAYVDVQQFGAQAVDLSQIPQIAIGRIEVLRDGASAQYGSDAIAGVINILLDDKPGINLTAQASQYYAGDGDNYQLAGRVGIPISDRGTISGSFEFVDGAHTDRAAPTATARNGQPDTRSYKGFVNFKYTVADNLELYGFGNYNFSRIENTFSHQDPATSRQYRRSVFQDGPPYIYPDFNLTDIYPDGYTPLFGAKIRDTSAVFGFRGNVTDTLTADLSGRYGRNSIDYFVNNSINPSLGPLSPTNFDAGQWSQTEVSANADFVLQVQAGLPTPVNISFGGEARQERFALRAGDYGSWAVGPLSDLTSGSHTYPGVSPAQAGAWDRGNVAAYLDVDVDFTTKFNVSAASRYEYFDDFGGNWSYKIASRYSATDWLNLRGSVSTGFHVPSPGQQNLTNTRQSPDLFDPLLTNTNGLIPSTNAVALAVGGKALKPERSFSFTGGLVLRPTHALTLSIDYYNIKVKDRLGISLDQALTTEQRNQLIADGISQAASLNQFRFFINGYDTRTQGVDIVANYTTPLAGGTLNLTGAYGYNSSKLLAGGDPRIVTQVFEQEIESRRPHHTGNIAADYRIGEISLFGKVRYYGKFMDAIAFLNDPAYNRTYGWMGARAFVDAAATWHVNKQLNLTVGAENLLGIYPDKLRGYLAAIGQRYPFLRPYEADGGRYYARVSANF